MQGKRRRPFRIALYLLAALHLLLFSCRERVSIHLDFSQASTWRYLLGVDINGSLYADDSLREFSSSLRTYLQGNISAHDQNSIYFLTDQPRISSDFLNDIEKKNLELELEHVKLLISPKEGALYTPDNHTLPAINIGEWDLLRNFTKVLPVLPENKVSPGERWEREREFPLETKYGDAIGHLYQVFKFDSLFSLDSSTEFAALSWIYSYKIEMRSYDSIAQSLNIPLSGNGEGTAVIDLKQHKIRKAHVRFDSEPTGGNQSEIKWNETIHLEIVE
ncbi:MAG: hypothetical protein GX640_09525 [Fibrobacter sp.]|nr:hypothetical protein [Fibrobacter sp.]